MINKTHRLIGLVIVLMIFTSSLSGCGGAMTAATTALKIAAVSALIDDSKNSNNKLVRILADIISGNVLREAIALITKPDGDEASIVLTLNDEGKYEGTYLAPTTDQTTPQEYAVEVTATDSTGNTAVSEPVTVEVPPTDAEPAP